MPLLRMMIGVVGSKSFQPDKVVQPASPEQHMRLRFQKRSFCGLIQQRLVMAIGTANGKNSIPHALVIAGLTVVLRRRILAIRVKRHQKRPIGLWRLIIGCFHLLAIRTSRYLKRFRSIGLYRAIYQPIKRQLMFRCRFTMANRGDGKFHNAP